MLRRLEPCTDYRSLSKGFWPSEFPLGQSSVIYGHNGSGKSSLSSLLLEVATESSSTEVIWEDEALEKHTVCEGEAGPSPAMAVFTKEWVRLNLTQFLDGKTASSIVTLGVEAIEAKEQEASLAKTIEELSSQADDARRDSEEAEVQIRELAAKAQDAIVEQLRGFDHNQFSKNRFSINVVMRRLREHKGSFPDKNANDEALARLGEGAPQRVPALPDAPSGLNEVLNGLETLLAETPKRIALATLAADQEWQQWAEQGFRIHERLNTCLFCGNDLTRDRREQLAKHFDKSYFEIRERAQTMLQGLLAGREAMRCWQQEIPKPDALAGELRDEYREHLEKAEAEAAKRLTVIEKLEQVLRVKEKDPAATPEAPDWSLLTGTLSAVATMQQAITKHNKHVDDHDQALENRYQTVVNHIIGSRSETFRQHEATKASAEQRAQSAQEKLGLANSELSKIRQKQFSTSKMAETLTKDLAQVYGAEHLSVRVTQDGKSYECLRADEPATHLSDGERTTLSLLYFLRKLEDETITGNRSERIVVIDDPSSSLDREALFATHQWLVDALKSFGQYIVLTHDFGLLQLFRKSLSNAWNKSHKKIQQGNADEKRFPKVAFLEMYAVTKDGRRKTQIASLPPMLANHTTEYAYLFSKVMEGVRDGTDHDHLFLLPNAARRVLEVFSSYKAPHLGTLEQRLADLMGEDQTKGPYRDVYNFCNRYSHGEGSEIVDVLDARVIHQQIRRCMEFMRYADVEHFERMCKATGADAAYLG